MRQPMPAWVEYVSGTKAMRRADDLEKADAEFALIAETVPADDAARLKCEGERTKIHDALIVAWLAKPGYPDVLNKLKSAPWAEVEQGRLKATILQDQLKKLDVYLGKDDAKALA